MTVKTITYIVSFDLKNSEHINSLSEHSNKFYSAILSKKV